MDNIKININNMEFIDKCCEITGNTRNSMLNIIICQYHYIVTNSIFQNSYHKTRLQALFDYKNYNKEDYIKAIQKGIDLDDWIDYEKYFNLNRNITDYDYSEIPF